MNSLRTSKGIRLKNSRKLVGKPLQVNQLTKAIQRSPFWSLRRRPASCIVSGANSKPSLRRCYGPVIGNGRKVAVVIGISIARRLPSFPKQLATVGLVRGRG